MSKDNNMKNIGDLLKEVLQNTSFENRVWEDKLKTWWVEIVGKTMAGYLVDFSFRDKKIYIRLRSAAARSELLFLRTEIKNRLNQKAGKEVIEEIVLH
ncbi:MAG: hypothetical protein CVU05_15745 [Bacteroidetes bacterium HGW-Bacteroidetes-21]|jgi:hypothetical protein|nr:MAG: hypothetical protein CVU05_15745 [Bacteroidetes bacterium HGW-Bacteroidetes-21]